MLETDVLQACWLLQSMYFQLQITFSSSIGLLNLISYNSINCITENKSIVLIEHVHVHV